jgi:hypothetical protein
MQDRFARHVLASRSLISAPLPLTRRILAAVMAHTARKGDGYFGCLKALDEKICMLADWVRRSCHLWHSREQVLAQRLEVISMEMQQRNVCLNCSTRL